MGNDMLSLPQCDIAVICYQEGTIKSLSELYPNWLYITEPSSTSELERLASDTRCIAVLGEDALRDFPYKADARFPCGTPFVLIKETGTYAVLKRICEVCEWSSTDYSERPLKQLPEVGVLAVGGSKTKVNLLKSVFPAWKFVKSFNPSILNEDWCMDSNLVVLLDYSSSLFKEYCSSYFGVQGVPVIAYMEGTYVWIKRMVERCDNEVVDLLTGKLP